MFPSALPLRPIATTAGPSKSSKSESRNEPEDEDLLDYDKDVALFSVIHLRVDDDFDNPD